KLGKEQAELFRRSVLAGAKDFLLAGAVLPEFESYSSYNPRQLMAPEVKLLTMPRNLNNETSDQISEEQEFNGEQQDMNREETELLRTLLEKSKRKKNKT
ncbi:MAG: hypothetical protein H7Z72_20855, partial [Bacteroidetes bacterium]|nr:hypothetical protein [Fibrella sp.]